MEIRRLKIKEKETLNRRGNLVRLLLEGAPEDARPGQFVNITVDGHYLKRPISISEAGDGMLALIIEKVGDGTERICAREPGEELEMLTGLGNSFSTPAEMRKPVLIGGGVGFAPLVGLARDLHKRGFEARCFWGFNAGDDVPEGLIEKLRKEGLKVDFATMKGDKGYAGNPLQMALEMAPDADYFYTCGPLGMMKAAAQTLTCGGELSLDARMGCGFGACMCCSVRTTGGAKRICKEGPIFKKEELIWTE